MEENILQLHSSVEAVELFVSVKDQSGRCGNRICLYLSTVVSVCVCLSAHGCVMTLQCAVAVCFL